MKRPWKGYYESLNEAAKGTYRYNIPGKIFTVYIFSGFELEREKMFSVEQF